MLYDALAMRFRELKLRRNPECPVCGDHPTITKPIDYYQFCGVPRQETVAVAESDIGGTVEAALQSGQKAADAILNIDK